MKLTNEDLKAVNTVRGFGQVDETTYAEEPHGGFPAPKASEKPTAPEGAAVAEKKEAPTEGTTFTAEGETTK